MLKIPIDIKNGWILEERLKCGKRKYLHFDQKISCLGNQIIKDIWNPVKVLKHSFYPFIRREKKWRRYKRIPGAKQRIIKEKIRPICYATHYDSLIYSWYAYVVGFFYENKIAELGIESNITAYRKLNKSNIDFAKSVIDYAVNKGECGIICFDLEKFFDTLDHEILKKNWEDVILVTRLPDDHFAIYKTITKFTYVDHKQLKDWIEQKKSAGFLTRICEPNEFRELRKNNPDIFIKNNEGKGIPQGSTISAVLSNVYMMSVDLELSSFIKSIDGLYQRYSDDIILVCPIEYINTVEEVLKKSVAKVKLSINNEKTERKIYKRINGRLCIVDLETSKISKLQYLGIEFDGDKVFLRHSGIANFGRKMIRSIKKAAARANKKQRPFPKKKILQRFFYSKKSNYLAYSKRASESFASHSIRRQTSPTRVIKKIKDNIRKFIEREKLNNNKK